ncbi:cytochrome P450 [Pseudonocardia pini]|uniref:cytochrome P450 n=1 Tax=Pseudonocardia pini TaxID=2758030 RepID=UPI0028AE490B|nr:cytochrome P450 [Pseudonocardia pini]
MTAQAGIDLTDMRPFVAGTQHELFRALRDHDPLHWNDETDGGRGFWSLTRYADVREGANDHQRLSSAEGTQLAERRVEGKLHSLHNMDEPEHGKLRRIAIPYLRAVKIKRWQQSIAESVTRLLDEAEAAGELEFVHAVSANLPIRVLARVLGVPAEDCATLAELSNVAHIQDPEYVTTDEQRETAREELFAYFKDLTAKRRADPQDDLVSVLVQGTVDGEPLSWEQLAAYYIVLMAAGNETTRHLTSGAVDAFDRYPEEWRRLRADRGLLGPAVEEMFRWVSPIAFMRRTAIAPVEWHGHTIEPGQKVLLWFGSANRDERVFADPDRFVVDRTPNDHLTFGWGVHFCMGAHLARAETAALFGQMIDRGLDVRLAAPPDRLEASMFAGIKRMPVTVTRSS